MADFNIAYNWMMDNEDMPRACATVPDSSPHGVAGPCYAISGINSGSWPAEYAQIAALDPSQREPLVQQFYQNHYWNQHYAAINSDEVCKRVFDFAVNAGAESIKCLQQAVNSVAAAGTSPLTADGGLGPMTVAAVNAATPDQQSEQNLVTAFQGQRVAFYQAIVANNPSNQKYLKGWTARAMK
ncbi:MAG: putative peptidoglycan-binding domain-containing protein [Terracidiphilus sp.]